MWLKTPKISINQEGMRLQRKTAKKGFKNMRKFHVIIGARDVVQKALTIIQIVGP